MSKPRQDRKVVFGQAAENTAKPTAGSWWAVPGLSREAFSRILRQKQVVIQNSDEGRKAKREWKP